MTERTPPFKIINPELAESDFDSSASSEVYRIVPAHELESSLGASNSHTSLKRRFLVADEIARCLRRQKVLMFDPVRIQQLRV